MSWIMELCIWANGIKMVLEKEEGLRFGKMGANTLAIGQMIKQTEEGD